MSGAHLLDLPPMQSSGTPALYKSNATNEPEGAQQSEEHGTSPTDAISENSFSNFQRIGIGICSGFTRRENGTD
jgi:hypothetical protein